MARGGMSVNTSGMEETLKQLEKVSNMSALANAALYHGAGVVADEMKVQVQNLKTSDDFVYGNKKRYALPEDKEALEDALGIAPMKDSGDGVNTKVGFDGYYEGRNGSRIPLPLVANSINAGTSFMYAQPFINRTIRASQDRCVKAMSDSLEDSIDNIMNK